MTNLQKMFLSLTTLEEYKADIAKNLKERKESVDKTRKQKTKQ